MGVSGKDDAFGAGPEIKFIEDWFVFTIYHDIVPRQIYFQIDYIVVLDVRFFDLDPC